MCNKAFVFKLPLTPETFRNGSFAKTSYKMHFQKPIHKHNLNSKKAQQESQLQVNVKPSILNNVTSTQDLQNSDVNKTGGGFFINVSILFFL